MTLSYIYIYIIHTYTYIYIYLYVCQGGWNHQRVPDSDHFGRTLLCATKTLGIELTKIYQNHAKSRFQLASSCYIRKMWKSRPSFRLVKRACFKALWKPLKRDRSERSTGAKAHASPCAREGLPHSHRQLLSEPWNEAEVSMSSA